MATNRAIVALCLLALVDRSLTLSCARCIRDNCTPPTCSYGTTRDNCHCCDVCLRGPGERCNEGVRYSHGPWGRCPEGFICGEKNLDQDDFSNYLAGTCIANDTGIAGDKCGGCSYGTQCYSGCSEGLICGKKDLEQSIQCDDRGLCSNPNYEVGICIVKDAGVAGDKCGGCFQDQCYSGCSEGFVCGEKDMDKYIKCDTGFCNNPNYGVGICISKGTGVAGDKCDSGYWETQTYSGCSEGFICGEKDMERDKYCYRLLCKNPNYGVGVCIAKGTGVAGDKCDSGYWKTQTYSGCSEGFICGEKDMKEDIQCDRGLCNNPNHGVGVCIAKDAGVAGDKCGGCSWGTQCYSGCSEGFICGEKDMEKDIQCIQFNVRRTCNNPNYGVGSCIGKETVTDLPTTKEVAEVPETTTALPSTKKAMKVPETTTDLPTTKEAVTTFPWTCGYCKERTLT